MPLNNRKASKAVYSDSTNPASNHDVPNIHMSENNVPNNHLPRNNVPKNNVSTTHDLFERLANGQTTLSEVTASAHRSRWQKLIGLPAYHWLLLAQLLVILPHALYMPVWLTIFGVVSITAQLPVIKASNFGRRRFYQLIQLAGFMGGLVGLWINYGLAFGVDMGVAFLLLCLICKLWELYKHRDAYVVLNLSLFVLAALFLMDQGLSTTIQVLFGLSAVLMAFIAINDDGNSKGSGRVRSFALLAGQALPLMIVLFMFFPRLPPLWSIQLSANQATTGVTNSMSPGDFANLSQSTELAFRVEFGDDKKPRSQLYWRGLVFSDFDGVTWTENENRELWRGDSRPEWITQSWASVSNDNKQNPVTYEIIMEPTQQRWLYGLDYPFAQERGVAISSEFTLRRRDPVTTQIRYEAMQFEGMRIDLTLDENMRQDNLALPEQGNAQAKAYAQKRFAESGNDPVRYIQSIGQWINSDEFHYTLSPPRLGTNRIDDFLFNTKAGFCEHYSSSFTFLMRAAGIPARVVAGYQGGELGRDGTSWEVRQMDAHAWSEVWLEGRGWVRVDPTSFVAPDRVEEGMDAFATQQGAAMFGTGVSAQLSYQQFKMLQNLRRLSDQVGYYWQRDIVGYDQDKQSNTLFKWFKIKSLLQQVTWMIVGFVILMAIIIGLIWYRRRKQWHPADLPIIQLSKRMAKNDETLSINQEEGILDWLSRLENQADSTEAIAAIRTIKSDYRNLRYGRQSTLDVKSADYQNRLKQLKEHAKSVR